MSTHSEGVCFGKTQTGQPEAHAVQFEKWRQQHLLPLLPVEKDTFGYQVERSIIAKLKKFWVEQNSAQWYRINAGPSAGEAEYLGSDVLQVDGENNVYLEATDTSFLPSTDRWQALTGKILPDGSFKLTGPLNNGYRS